MIIFWLIPMHWKMKLYDHGFKLKHFPTHFPTSVSGGHFTLNFFSRTNFFTTGLMWKLILHLLFQEYGVSVETTHNRSKLTLPEVTKDDCGEYQCVASNTQGEMKTSVNLCVTNKSGSLHSLLQVNIVHSKFTFRGIQSFLNYSQI